MSFHPIVPAISIKLILSEWRHEVIGKGIQTYPKLIADAYMLC